jgi:hypothetical protein
MNTLLRPTVLQISMGTWSPRMFGVIGSKQRQTPTFASHYRERFREYDVPGRRPVLLLRKHESNPTATSFADFAHSKEAKEIIEEMFVPYTDPEIEPHAVHSLMGQ